MSIVSRTARPLLILAILTLIHLESATACPYCFGTGSAESSVTEGARMAIVTLLGVTGSVLGAFAFFFFRLLKRSNREVTDVDQS